MQYRFLHCADVHLGKYAHQNPERYGDYFVALGAVVAYAGREQVDALLIAGDLFDEQEPSNETLMRAMETLRPLRDAGITVVAIEGNHDRRKRTEPAGALDVLHSEGYVQLLRPRYHEQRITLEGEEARALCIPLPGITIAGIGFVAHNIEEYLAQAAMQLPENDFVILLAHVMITRGREDVEYGCVSMEDVQILRERVGYLALGHRHTRMGLDGETDGWVFNPGSLEYVNSLDYRLPSDLRGFYDVTVSDSPLPKDDSGLSTESRGRYLRVRHIPTDKRPACTLRVDVSGLSHPSEVVEALKSEAEAHLAVKAQSRKPIVIVRLYGAPAMSRSLLPLEALAQLLREDFNALHAEIMTADLLGNVSSTSLIVDAEGMELLADRARAITADLLKSRGIAHGREHELSTALIDLKAQLQGVARTPSENILESVRSRLSPFIEMPVAATLPEDEGGGGIGEEATE
jgi:DNA repair protein SbcD/Mre11